MCAPSILFIHLPPPGHHLCAPMATMGSYPLVDLPICWHGGQGLFLALKRCPSPCLAAPLFQTVSLALTPVQGHNGNTYFPPKLIQDRVRVLLQLNASLQEAPPPTWASVYKARLPPPNAQANPHRKHAPCAWGFGLPQHAPISHETAPPASPTDPCKTRLMQEVTQFQGKIQETYEIHNCSSYFQCSPILDPATFAPL